ncbi:hypothetical protein M3667_03135 [Microbacterium sp. P26]|uniref:hypothetical protein n=1 Tax=Microbacterium TaxID=33882 RepID=UPI00203DF555|nr:hypothetical protein [Microbacterium sp. P26]MCM3500871.1 hypothetical protein [Microbacterium sp. P26]
MSSRWVRVLVFVLVVVLSTTLPVGVGVLLTVQSSESSGGELFLSIFASIGFVVGPLLVGSWMAFWDPRRSADSRRIFRRIWVTVILSEVVSAALIIAYTVLAGAPVWLPVVFIVVGSALMAAAFWLGNLLRTTAPAPAALPAESLYPPAERRRDVRRIVVAALITMVVVSALCTALALTVGLGDAWFPVVCFPLAFALIVGGGMSSLPTFRVGRRARALVDGDLGRLRTIGKAVTRSKGPTLTAEDEMAAARYAPAAAILMTYQVVNIVTLYLALGLLQVNNLSSSSTDPAFRILSIVLLAFFVVTLVVLVPLQIRQIRRARAYASAHPAPRSEWVDSPSEAPGA